MDTKKKNLLLVVGISFAAVAVAVTMVLVYFFVILPKPQEGQKIVTLQIVYADNSYSFEDKVTEKGYVFDFLLELSGNDGFTFEYTVSQEFGAFITSFMGNDAQGNGWYCFIFSGEEALLGVSFVALSTQDKNMVRFEYKDYMTNELLAEPNAK